MRHAVLAAATSISFTEVTNGTFGRTVVPAGAPILKS
jgi:hypothetical protein